MVQTAKMSMIVRKVRLLQVSVRCLSSSATSSDAKVKIPELGEVQGTVEETAWTKRKFAQFLGIKYAEAPVGNLRFKAPVPAKPWEGTYDATKPGQPGVMLKNIKAIPDDKLDESFEDCLNLSVYTNGVEKKKPVMVYIHGGAFWDGSAAEYPGNYLLEKDVVLVVPQYRLGPLGFLSTMTEEIPGNAAVLDIVLALEWVQKYISNFGGDPNNVTLVGQSAGAGIASCIFYSPTITQTLYHKIILQSGSPFSSWIYNMTPEKCAREIVGWAGLDNKVPLAELNKCLMNINIKPLYKGFNKHIITGTPRGIDTIGGLRMTIGGPSNLLPHPPHVLMTHGGGKKNMPMLIGCTKHDATFALGDMYDVLMGTKVGTENKKFNTMKMIEHMTRRYGIDDFTGSIETLATKWFWTDDEIKSGKFEEMIDGFTDLSNVVMIKAAVLKMAKAHKYLNNDTYLYSFNYKGQYTRFGYGKDTSYYPFNGGVHHSDDNIYIFPCPHPDLNEEDKKIAHRMVELWTSFATNGAPQANDVESWPKMDTFNGPYLRIDREAKVREDFLQEFNICAREKWDRQKQS